MPGILFCAQDFPALSMKKNRLATNLNRCYNAGHRRPSSISSFRCPAARAVGHHRGRSMEDRMNNEIVTIVNNATVTLAETREELESAKALKKSIEEVVANSFAGKQLAAASAYVKELMGMESAQKSDLMAALKRLYLASGSDDWDRHPAVHQVRKPVSLTYSAEDAIEYCIEHHPEFLVLNTRKFENFVKKSGADLSSFVTREEGVEIVVKGDLGEFLR